MRLECWTFSLAYLWSFNFPWPAAMLRHRVSPPRFFPRSAWSRCSDLYCRQSRASGNGTGVRTTDTPWRKGAEGHRKPSWSISFNIWPDRFEKKTFNKMQASTRVSTNCFLKNSSSYETLPLHIGMAKSKRKPSTKYLLQSESMSLYNTTQNRASAAVIKNMQHLHKVTNTFAQTLLLLPLHMVTCLDFFFLNLPWHQGQTDLLSLRHSRSAMSMPRLPAPNVTTENPGWVKPGLDQH